MIYLVPFGTPDGKLLKKLRQAIETAFGTEAAIAPALEPPPEALDAARGQYRAEALLQALKEAQPEAERVLGVLDADCYSAGLNYVFGQAEWPGRTAVIALKRLRTHHAEPDYVFSQRAIKEALHELGHTFGLRHCADPSCVMHFSNRLEDTDFKTAAFCLRDHGEGRAAI